MMKIHTIRRHPIGRQLQIGRKIQSCRVGGILQSGGECSTSCTGRYSIHLGEKGGQIHITLGIGLSSGTEG
jgi:hypothetical protein